MLLPRLSIVFFVLNVSLLVRPALGLVSALEQFQGPLTLQKLASAQDATVSSAVFPSFENLDVRVRSANAVPTGKLAPSLPLMASLLAEDVAVDGSVPGSATKEQELLLPPTQAIALKHEAKALSPDMRRLEQSGATGSPSASVAKKAHHFRGRRVAAAVSKPGTYPAAVFKEDSDTVRTTGIPVSQNASAAENAEATTDAVNNASIYSRIGMVGGLLLQVFLLTVIMSFIHVHCVGVSFGEVMAAIGYPSAALAVLVFLLCDAAWIFACATGMLDEYIQGFMAAAFCGTLGVLHVAIIGMLVHRWAVNVVEKQPAVIKFHEAAEKVIRIETKIEQIYNGLSLNKEALYDSETEKGPHPAKDGPGPNKPRFPILVTAVRANNLKDMDASIDDHFTLAGRVFTDLSDPYVTCAVRGRRAACWQKSPVINNNLNPEWNYTFKVHRFREQDTLKLKVWDSDLNMMSSDNLGNLSLDFSTVKRLADSGKPEEFKLKQYPQSSEEEELERDLKEMEGAVNKEPSTLTIKIERLSHAKAKATCSCGNVFADDAEFCRTCGKKRVDASPPDAMSFMDKAKNMGRWC